MISVNVPEQEELNSIVIRKTAQWCSVIFQRGNTDNSFRQTVSFRGLNKLSDVAATLYGPEGRTIRLLLFYQNGKASITSKRGQSSMNAEAA